MKAVCVAGIVLAILLSPALSLPEEDESENEMPATDVQEWGENEVEEQELDSEMPVESESEDADVQRLYKWSIQVATAYMSSRAPLRCKYHLTRAYGYARGCTFLSCRRAKAAAKRQLRYAYRPLYCYRWIYVYPACRKYGCKWFG